MMNNEILNADEFKADAKSKIRLDIKGIFRFFTKNYLLVCFIVLVFACMILSNKFMTTRNIMNILLQNSMYAIIGIGMLFVIIAGGIDLSVGSVVALSVCFTAGFIQDNMGVMAVVVVLILMALVGLVTGILVTYGKVAPFVATLAMMTILRGEAYIYQVGSDRRIDGTFLPNFINSNVGGIPTPVIIMVIIVVISAFTLGKTTFGRSIYAIGGNAETARLAGINVKLHVILVYVISGVLAGLAGIILAGRLSMGTALVGEGFELDAIAAVVVGGAALSGGTGTVMNTVIGAFIIGVLANIMNLMGVAAYPQMIIKGVIILIAVMARRD